MYLIIQASGIPGSWMFLLGSCLLPFYASPFLSLPLLPPLCLSLSPSLLFSISGERCLSPPSRPPQSRPRSPSLCLFLSVPLPPLTCVCSHLFLPWVSLSLYLPVSLCISLSLPCHSRWPSLSAPVAIQPKLFQDYKGGTGRKAGLKEPDTQTSRSAGICQRHLEQQTPWPPEVGKQVAGWG